MINALSTMLAAKIWPQQQPPVTLQEWSSLHSLSCTMPCKVAVPGKVAVPQHPEHRTITLELLRKSEVITLEEVFKLEEDISASQMTGNIQIERDITRKCFTEQNTEKHVLTGIERFLWHYLETGSFKSTTVPKVRLFSGNFNSDLSEESEEAKQLIAAIVIEQCKSVRETIQKTHNRHSSRLILLNRWLGQAPVKRREIEQLIPYEQDIVSPLDQATSKRCRIEQLTSNSVMIPLTSILHEWSGVAAVAPREQRDFICAATLLTLLVSKS